MSLYLLTNKGSENFATFAAVAANRATFSRDTPLGKFAFNWVRKSDIEKPESGFMRENYKSLHALRELRNFCSRSCK